MPHLAQHLRALLPGLRPEVLSEARRVLPVEPVDPCRGVEWSAGARESAVSKAVEDQVASSGPTGAVVAQVADLSIGQVEHAVDPFKITPEHRALGGEPAGRERPAVLPRPKLRALAVEVPAQPRARQPHLARRFRAAQEDGAIASEPVGRERPAVLPRPKLRALAVEVHAQPRARQSHLARRLHAAQEDGAFGPQAVRPQPRQGRAVQDQAVEPGRAQDGRFVEAAIGEIDVAPDPAAFEVERPGDQGADNLHALVVHRAVLHPVQDQRAQ
ncbi:hypothetical protein DRV85_04060 [Rhodosalinus halophilus]|uniref:Uncharacterized protein n=2 Tax=Rhodosalinus halophilus TaxID=2259333 RepID=A0A365UBT9_9RHOB|nr:hypothetical protein DRV85_04060 [Rhodosalinus halophilus]